MKKINFAIVGCGRIAQRHAEHIVNNGQLKAVCDIDMEKAKILSEKYGAVAYQYIDDLLAEAQDVDVVSICSPNGLHAEHSIKALNAGFHVLCEKPMAISVYDCGEMIKAAEKTIVVYLPSNKTVLIHLWLRSRKLSIGAIWVKFTAYN